MKLHHAAALALVWYLMYQAHPAPDRSFSEPGPGWAILDSFRTAAECKAAQSKTMQSAMRMLDDAGRPGGITDGVFLAQQSLRAGCKCVADDDPRLKGD